jgi:3-phenylpropionate/trans-cinnamate dioxygenase ferredoxin reductase component
MSERTVVILGAGLAGASAAAALRKHGFDGRIVLVGNEAHLPYERPGLSKEYLRGEQDATSLAARPEPFYAEQDIDLRLGVTAGSLRPSERTVLLSDGVVLGYDRLLLATGAAPRGLGVPGENLRGVYNLRTIEDADAIRSAASAAEHVVVVGGGWIGAEVAASLRQSGVDVSLVAATNWPLERTLGSEVGALFGDLHARHGVRLLMNRRVVGIRGSGSVETVALDDGSSVAADVVVAGIGVVPRTALAVEAGIASHDGILVDATLETSVPGIFAAGDVASAWHPILARRIRVEHWDNAKRQGTAVAAGLMGDPRPYARVPYFFSDQFDLSMEYAGFAPEWDRVVLRRDRETAGFTAFWLAGGRLLAGMQANVEGSMKSISALVAARPWLDPVRLADAEIPLESLLPAAGAGEAAA